MGTQKIHSVFPLHNEKVMAADISSRLWKWPAKEDHIFYYLKDIVTTMKPPEMEKCGIRMFFRFPEMNSLNVLHHFK